jgi:hypothetical protein
MLGIDAFAFDFLKFERFGFQYKFSWIIGELLN